MSATDSALKQGTLLVTGAASGIGAAVARRFAHAGTGADTGADVGTGAIYALDVDATGLEALINELRDVGVRCAAEVVDVQDAAALEAAFGRASERFGALDWVHNNVGIMTGFPPFPDTPLEQLDRLLAINLRSVVLGVQLACRHFGERGGSILNTSSFAAMTPLPTDPIYAGSKAAINQFTRSCAPLLKKRGIRINALCPGVVDTAILAQNQHPEYQPESSADFLRAQGYQMLSPETIAEHAFELLTSPDLSGETRVVRNEPSDS